MNCKQFEMVRFVGQNKNNRPNVRGWIGQTLYPTTGPHGPGWRVEPPLPGGEIPASDGSYWPGDLIYDRDLRPIRGGESPEQSIEAMRDLLQTKKEKETT